jgi:hypothetical protein
MQDRSINSALVALRKQIIRGNGAGLDHIEALMALRGVELRPVLPPRSKDAARRGHMAAMVVSALRENGPQTARDVTEYVAKRRPEIAHADAHKRAAMALSNLKIKGLVRRYGRLWLLG